MPESPERYYRVSETQLSIARYYGGAKVNDVDYVYDADTDTLIRSDLVAAKEAEAAKWKRLQAQANRERLAAEESRQGNLFGGDRHGPDVR